MLCGIDWVGDLDEAFGIPMGSTKQRMGLVVSASSMHALRARCALSGRVLRRDKAV